MLNAIHSLQPDKKKIKFSSYIVKFRMDQLQSRIWITASSYMGKYLRISSYIRKPFLIYDFATAPLLISLYMRKIWFYFLSVHRCCAAHRTFRYFELCSICLRESLGRSKPATNPWNKHNNTTVRISTISKPYWTVFYRIKWALQMWVS